MSHRAPREDRGRGRFPLVLLLVAVMLAVTTGGLVAAAFVLGG